MVDASGTWVVDDSLDATDESLTESPIPPNFIRSSISADLDGSDIESEHEVGSRPSSVDNSSTPSPGMKEAVSGVCARIPHLVRNRPVRTSRPPTPTRFSM